LSRRKKALLETNYIQYREGCTSVIPGVARSLCASQLDLPPGSFSIQVVAALHGRLASLPESVLRLAEVSECLVELEHISKEEAETTYGALCICPFHLEPSGLSWLQQCNLNRISVDIELSMQ
jgi:hypothetical protein